MTPIVTSHRFDSEVANVIIDSFVFTLFESLIYLVTNDR